MKYNKIISYYTRKRTVTGEIPNLEFLQLAVQVDA